MKRKIHGGATSLIERVFIRDTSQATMVAGLTGLTYASSGLTLYYCRAGANATTAISLSAGTLGTWSSGGFVEMDSSHMPGWYEIGIPNAAIATGVSSVGFHLCGATNMEGIPWMVELDAVDYQDAVRFGLSCLPPATAGATSGLPTLNSAGNVPSDQTGTTTLLTRIPGTVQPQTGDAFARLGAPAGVSTAADIAAVKTSVGSPMQSSATPTVGGYTAGQDPATLVLDATAADHDTDGTVGAKISSSGAVIRNVTVVQRNVTVSES